MVVSARPLVGVLVPALRPGRFQIGQIAPWLPSSVLRAARGVQSRGTALIPPFYVTNSQGGQKGWSGDLTQSARHCLHPASGTAKVWGVEGLPRCPENAPVSRVYGILICEMAIWDFSLWSYVRSRGVKILSRHPNTVEIKS